MVMLDMLASRRVLHCQTCGCAGCRQVQAGAPFSQTRAHAPGPTRAATAQGAALHVLFNPANLARSKTRNLLIDDAEHARIVRMTIPTREAAAQGAALDVLVDPRQHVLRKRQLGVHHGHLGGGGG